VYVWKYFWPRQPAQKDYHEHWNWKKEKVVKFIFIYVWLVSFVPKGQIVVVAKVKTKGNSWKLKECLMQ